MDTLFKDEGEMIAKALHLEVGKAYRVQLVHGESKYMYFRGTDGPVLTWTWQQADFRCLARYVVYATPG
jgi:hypothetical protein